MGSRLSPILIHKDKHGTNGRFHQPLTHKASTGQTALTKQARDKRPFPPNSSSIKAKTAQTAVFPNSHSQNQVQDKLPFPPILIHKDKYGTNGRFSPNPRIRGQGWVMSVPCMITAAIFHHHLAQRKTVSLYEYKFYCFGKSLIKFCNPSHRYIPFSNRATFPKASPVSNGTRSMLLSSSESTLS